MSAKNDTLRDWGRLTTSRLGKLGQAEQGIVAGYGLKGNVRVPLGLLALSLVLAEEPV